MDVIRRPLLSLRDLSLELLQGIADELDVEDAVRLSGASKHLVPSLCNRNVQKYVEEHGGAILCHAAKDGFAELVIIALDAGASMAPEALKELAGLSTFEASKGRGRRSLQPDNADPADIFREAEMSGVCPFPAPLHLTFHHGHNDVAKLLLERGAETHGGLDLCHNKYGELNPKYSDQVNLVGFCWTEKHREGDAPRPPFGAMRFSLLSCCVEYSPLYIAVRSGNTEMAIELLDRGASRITVTDHPCRHRSAYGHSADSVAWASSGWNNESVGIGHVVIDAIVAGDVEVLRHVLRARPEESVQRISQHCDFNSAIYRLSGCAMGEKVPEILQLLLSHGAGVDMLARLPVSLRKGPDVRPKRVAYTPLQYAACHRTLDAFNALWAAGARLGALLDRAWRKQGLDVVGRMLACWFNALEQYADLAPGGDLEANPPKQEVGAFVPFLCFLREQDHVLSKETLHWATRTVDGENCVVLGYCYHLQRSGIPPSIFEVPDLEWALVRWYYYRRCWARRELEREIECLPESGARANWSDMPFSLPHFARLLLMPDMPGAECSENDDDAVRRETQRAKFGGAHSRVDMPFSLSHLAQLLSRHPPYIELWEVPIQLDCCYDVTISRELPLIGARAASLVETTGGPGPSPLTFTIRLTGSGVIWHNMLARGLQVQEPIPGRMPGHLIKALYARDWHFPKWLVQNMGPGNITTDEAANFIHLLSTANIGVPDSVVHDILPRLEDLAKSGPWVEKLTWCD